MFNFDENDKTELWRESFKRLLIYLPRNNLEEFIKISDQGIARYQHERLSNPDNNEIDIFFVEKRMEHLQEEKKLCQRQLEIRSEISEEGQKPLLNLGNILLFGMVILLIILVSKFK